MKHRPTTEAPPIDRLTVVVLAAGKGTRLPGAGPKVLVECLGAPLLDHVRRAVSALSPDETLVVTGFGRELVEPWVASRWPGAKTVLQSPQNGTGHAVRVALKGAAKQGGDVIVVCGDVPQVEADDLRALLDAHRRARADATVLVGAASDPGQLGRIVREGTTGRFARIVEAKDASPETLALREFNTGIYAFAEAPLREAVADLPRRNAQGEEYLTDAVGAIAASGGKVETERSSDGSALLGVNTPTDLARAVGALRRRIVGRHLAAGVLIVDPDTTVIEPDVEIAAGARILPFTYLGHGCRIGADCVVGPFAHLRGGTVLEKGAQIGNFVEVKATTMGPGAKAKHLTYLGDAEVGEGANIGCGTITANFDGKNKHRTKVGAGARIGSGTVLVAPVTVGANARTGANAVVTAGRNVAPGATVVGVPARPLDPKGRAAPAAKPVAVPKVAARPASKSSSRPAAAKSASKGRSK